MTFDNWSRASQRILDEPSLSMDAATCRPDGLAGHLWRSHREHRQALRQLVASSPRRPGELTLTPTPVYDMLPMVFAPADANLVERQFAPRPPTALNLHLWHEVANHALKVLVTPLRRGRTQRRLPTNFHGMPRHARPVHCRISRTKRWTTSALTSPAAHHLA